MPELSERAKHIVMSPIAKQMELAKKLASSGAPIIDLTIGETDFSVADDIKEAGIEAIEHDLGRYTAANGTLELREHLARKFRTAIERITVSNGAKSILSSVFSCILSVGDEVILPVPSWPCYREMIHICGATDIMVTCPESDRYLLTADRLLENLTPNTKAIVLNSPCNPTGQAYSKKELKDLLDICIEYDIFLVFDAAYIDLSDAPFPVLSDHVIYVGSASKSYAMSGWRIGWCICSEELSSALNRYVNNCIGSPSGISQYALLRALDHTLELEKEICSERCSVVANAVNAAKGMHCLKPDGSLYVWVALDSISDDIGFAKRLLEKEFVSVTPGSGFGLSGHVRIACTKDIPILLEGIKRIERCLKTAKRYLD